MLIRSHHGIIPAISVEVETVDGFRVDIGDIVDGDESAGFRIVIARFEEVQSRFCIVEVSAVAERIEAADMIDVGNVCAVRVQYRMVPPCVVHILYHNIPAAVKKGLNFLLKRSRGDSPLLVLMLFYLILFQFMPQYCLLLFQKYRYIYRY